MANIECPLAGKVFEILVEVGQQINEDDEIFLIDAMKMENPIYSTASGTVKEIKVKVGEQVAEGTILAVVE
ncbi:MAG: acetyl-CoA carboxylase biotin carboxyl carrier protein subunit [Syntrophomonadaceae bacterium]|jgi:acetyl-CoA carboxylase biotin carboxyl carrier protein|nr:acetyl-CoA carboxylase biotin carboxyl carrier protein subunit [Syntrophomonadaceae bacterium]